MSVTRFTQSVLFRVLRSLIAGSWRIAIVWPALLLGFWSMGDMAVSMPVISGDYRLVQLQQEASQWQNAPVGKFLTERCFSPKGNGKPKPVLKEDCWLEPVSLEEKVADEAIRAFSKYLIALSLSVLYAMGRDTIKRLSKG